VSLSRVSMDRYKGKVVQNKRESCRFSKTGGVAEEGGEEKNKEKRILVKGGATKLIRRGGTLLRKIGRPRGERGRGEL